MSNHELADTVFLTLKCDLRDLADQATRIVVPYATPTTTGKLHRGRMFHVHYKPLWAAIGEPDDRFRKPAAQGRMMERVMLLDPVLDDREFTWLGPAMDKRRHFMGYLEDRRGRPFLSGSARPTECRLHLHILIEPPPWSVLSCPPNRTKVTGPASGYDQAPVLPSGEL